MELSSTLHLKYLAKSGRRRSPGSPTTFWICVTDETSGKKEKKAHWQNRTTAKSFTQSEEKRSRQKKTASANDVKKLIVESEQETARRSLTLRNC